MRIHNNAEKVTIGTKNIKKNPAIPTENKSLKQQRKKKAEVKKQKNNKTYIQAFQCLR